MNWVKIFQLKPLLSLAGCTNAMINGNSRHRVLVSVGKVDTEILLIFDIRGHTQLCLGFAVPIDQVIIAYRPVDELRNGLAVERLHLEIARQESQASAEPVRRAAGDAIVSASERQRPGLNQIA